MTTWHLDPAMARRYAGGGTAPAFAASVEQHLTGCPDCRALVPQDDARVDRIWAEVLDAVEAPRVGPVEAVLRRFGVSHATARLVAATPALRGAWMVASLVVVLLAVAASQAGEHGTLMFVALAPVLPVLGVALCFGDRADPTLEVAVASPYSLVRLLAARTSFVVATSMVPAAVVVPLLSGDRLFALTWMLPALAMSATVLAAARRVQPALTATALTVGWVTATVRRFSTHGSLVARYPDLVQLVSLVALAAAVASLVRHRHEPVAPLRRNA
jgi:hypothetical protein